MKLSWAGWHSTECHALVLNSRHHELFSWSFFFRGMRTVRVVAEEAKAELTLYVDCDGYSGISEQVL